MITEQTVTVTVPVKGSAAPCPYAGPVAVPAVDS